MGPKLMNCCRPEQVSTKEHGKMLKRIQILEDGRVLAKEANNLKIEAQKRRITRKEYQRLLNKFEIEGLLRKRISKKRNFACVEEQEDMNYEGTLVKAPPCPKRRMRTPLLQQSSFSAMEEGSPWSAQERMTIAIEGQKEENHLEGILETVK